MTMNQPIQESQIKQRTKDGSYVLKLTCVSCKQPVEIILSGSEMFKLQTSNSFIQSVLLHHTPGEREMFISGICNTCFEKMFQDDEEED